MPPVELQGSLQELGRLVLELAESRPQRHFMSSLTVRVLALCTASGTSGSEPKRATADRGTLQNVGCHHAFMLGDPGLFV